MPTRSFPAPAGTVAPAGSTPLPAVTPAADSMVLVSNGTAAGTGYALQAAFRGPKGDTGAQGPQGIQGVPGPAGSGTGTSFTPGRSVSLVGGTLEAGGYFNARSFGAIGDGQSRTLAQMASFRGQNTSGWTLAQWQTVLPHVTALGNQLDWACIQDALRACKTAGGGTVYLPRGAYVMDAVNPISLPCNPVVHLRGDGQASALLYNADLGPALNKCGIVGDDPMSIDSWLEISHLTIAGGDVTVPVGTRPYNMSAVHLHQKMRMYKCFVRGFFAAAHITHDHQQIISCKFDNNYYNIYLGYIDGQTFGNHYIAYCTLDHAKFASIGVHWANAADMFTLYSCHLGFGPYGAYKEKAPDGQTARFFIVNSVWTDVFAEACGNGGIYDENTRCDTLTNVFDNVNIDMTPWGDGRYAIASRPVTAAVHVGNFSNNRVIGAQELVSASSARDRGVQAAVIARGAVAGNDFGNISNWINDSQGDGRPYLLTGDYGEGNAWRGGTRAGFLAQVADQSATVPAGTLVRTRYGAIHALPWDGQAPVAGVTQMPAANGSLVPIATSGIATVRKTGAQVNNGTRMAASLGTVGAAEARSPGVSSPGIGQAVFDAAAADATLGVRLELSNPRHVGAVPSLTYSRAGETAAQAQLRAALVTQGLAVDATVA